MKLGLSLGLTGVRRAATVPVYDPAVEAWTLWVRGAYAGSPWSGTASAGASGSRALSEPTNAPSVGASLNGYASASYDGTNDILSNTSTITNFITSAAWSAAALVNIAAVGSTYPNIIGDSGGYWGLGTRNNSGNKFYAYQYDGGGAKYLETALTLSTWTFVQAKYDGANLRLRLNGGAWSTLATGGILVVSGTLFTGRNYASSSYLNGLVQELILATTAKSDTVFDNLWSYVQARYGI